MQFYKYSAVFTPEKKGSDVYNVFFPALPEIATFGSSIEEARFMAQDALELVILSHLEEGRKIPADKKPTKISPNAKTEEIVVTVSHQVNATPASYVKTAIFQSA